MMTGRSPTGSLERIIGQAGATLSSSKHPVAAIILILPVVILLLLATASLMPCPGRTTPVVVADTKKPAGPVMARTAPQFNEQVIEKAKAKTGAISSRSQCSVCSGDDTINNTGLRQATGLRYHPFDRSHLSQVPVRGIAVSPTTSKEKRGGDVAGQTFYKLGLPASFDLRSSGMVTPVRDQLNCGTCWAFGTIAVLEGRALKQDAFAYDLSEQGLITGADPSFAWLAGDRCNGGGETFTATDTLFRRGAILESAQPYNPATINTEIFNSTAVPVYRITDMRIVTDDAAQTALIKDAIYRYGPASAVYYMDSSSVGTGHLYPGWVYHFPNCSNQPNHMVTLVGWDDSIPWPGGAGSGAYIAKNSWGTSWGDNGYFYLTYGSANLQQVASYHGSRGFHYWDYYERVYLWDEAGFVNSVGWAGSDFAWFASSFTAAADGEMTAVSFWTTSNNAEYQIYVYDGSLPITGDLRTQKTGTAAEMGLYTIPLDTRVSLTAGQTFSVTVRMTTPGYNYPIPIEYVIPDWYSPPIQVGRTYIRHQDFDSWQDAANYGWNVCLRATVVDNGSPPEAPTGLATSNVLSTRVDLSWQDQSSTETGFRIERRAGSGEWSQIATVGNNITTYSDIGLTPGTTYTWRVCAWNSAGNSPWSNEVACTTGLLPVVSTMPATSLTDNSAVLNGLLSDLGSATSVTVSFEYGVAPGTYTMETATRLLSAPTAFSSNVSNLVYNQTYYFRAKAAGAGVTVYGAETAFDAVPDWDVNLDSSVNIGDVVVIGLAWGQTGAPHWIRADVNRDGVINIADVVVVGLAWGWQR